MMSYNLTDSTNTIYDAVYNFTDARWLEIATTTNQTATNVLTAALISSQELETTITYTAALTQIPIAADLIVNGSQSEDATYVAANAVLWTYYTIEMATYELAGFSPPTNNSEDASAAFDDVDFTSDETFDDIQLKSNEIDGVFTLTFVYFLVSTGLVIMLCTLIAALSKREKRTVHWIRLGVSGVIGLMLCLIAITAVTAESDTNP